MVIADIRIELKHGVTDPEGQNTLKALELLGFEGVRAVRTVKVFEIDLDAEGDGALQMCENMCRKLLANPVIQNYQIELK